MKPIDFAYELRRLTDGFNLEPLTDQRAEALYSEYGGQPNEVVKRAIENLLRGDRYPTASQITAAFVSAKLWDHEQRKRSQAATRGHGATADAVLAKLAGERSRDVDPRVPAFCVEVLGLFLRNEPPRVLAAFYRRYAADLPLELRIHDEADVLEGWGEAWPPGSVLFPIAMGWRAAPEPAPEQAGLW